MKKSSFQTLSLICAFTLLCAAGCQNGGKLGAKEPAIPESEANPKLNASTYYAHAHLLERQGALEQAVQQYQKAIELSPKFASALNRLGVTLNKLGRHAEATDAFRRAIAVQPNEGHLYNNLGFSQYLEENLTDAENSLERALALKPDFARARMNLGLVAAKRGDFAKAFRTFSLVCPPADAHYNVAMLQTEAGHYADAARSLEAALQSDTTHALARAQLREVARLAAESEVAPAIAAGSSTGQPPMAPSSSSMTTTNLPGAAPSAPIASASPVAKSTAEPKSMPPATAAKPAAPPVQPEPRQPTLLASDSTLPPSAPAAPKMASSPGPRPLATAAPIANGSANADALDLGSGTTIQLSRGAGLEKVEPETATNARTETRNPQPTPVSNSTVGIRPTQPITQSTPKTAPKDDTPTMMQPVPPNSSSQKPTMYRVAPPASSTPQTNDAAAIEAEIRKLAEEALCDQPPQENDDDC